MADASMQYKTNAVIGGKGNQVNKLIPNRPVQEKSKDTKHNQQEIFQEQNQNKVHYSCYGNRKTVQDVHL